MPKWLIFLIAAATTCLLFINFCNFVFGCGCTWMWAGAADHCNVHHGPKRCPWCTMSLVGQLGIWLTMVIPQGMISFWKTEWWWPVRLTFALIAFPAAGFLAALVTGTITGYWN